MIGPVLENSVWTKMLRKLISEEECELGMHLTKTPISAEDLAKKVGMPEEEVAGMLWNMADHGTIFPHFVNGKPYYRLVPFIPGVYEYQMDYRTMDKEMAELFVKAPAEVAWLTRNLSRIDGGIMKVVPVRQEVVAQPKVLSFEDVMTFIDGVDMYTVADCACRYAMKLLGTGCDHPIEAICLQLGPHAEYYEKTGRGRRITREEAIEVLNKAEEAGLVHNVFATEGLNNSSFICNCCGCSCSGFRVTRQYGGGAISASNFRARIDEEKCVACGACVDICPTNAIRLGDGLCKSAGGADRRIRDLLRHDVGQEEVGQRLPGQDRGDQQGHRALQDQVPRAHLRPGLHPERGGGQVHGSAGVDQGRQPLPGRLRQDLPASLRGRMHARHG